MMIVLIAAFAQGVPKPDAAHLTLAAYICLCLCWAWPPSRFIAVLLPLVFFTVRQTLARFGLHRLMTAAAGLLFCLVLTGDLRRIPQTVSNGQFDFSRNTADNWTELTGIFDWLRNNSPPNSIFLANLDPSLFLYTGRKSMRDFVPDARKLFYAPGSPTEDSLGSLEEIIRSSSADFLIVTPDKGFTEAPVLRRNIERLKTEHPGKLDLVTRPGSDP